MFRTVLLLIQIAEFTAKWIFPGIILIVLTVFVARNSSSKPVLPTNDYYLTKNVSCISTSDKAIKGCENSSSTLLDDNNVSLTELIETKP